jgi:hypothetical protein
MEKARNKRQEKLKKIEECMDRLAIQQGLHNTEHKILHDFMRIVKEMIKEVYEDVNEL